MKEQLIELAKQKGFKSMLYDLPPFQVMPLPEEYFIYWLAELQKWLREEHDVQVYAKPVNNPNWSVYVDRWGHHLVTEYIVHETYEQALEAGLIEALKLI